MISIAPEVLLLTMATVVGIILARLVVHMFKPPLPQANTAMAICFPLALIAFLLIRQADMTITLLFVYVALLCISTLDIWFGQVHDSATVIFFLLTMAISAWDQTLSERWLLALAVFIVGACLASLSGALGGADVVVLSGITLLVGTFGILTVLSVAFLILIAQAVIQLLVAKGQRGTPFTPALSVGALYTLSA